MLGYSKQAYYKRLQHQEEKILEEHVILDLIQKKRKLWKGGSGRNLLAALQEDFKEHNISMGRDRFFALLRSRNLLKKRKTHKAITTNSYHHYHKYPNLIRGLEPTGPNQVLVSDITYIWIHEVENFAYLSLITDMYSRKIVGYDISDSLAATGALRALKMATRSMTKQEMSNCIHHSDRGVQYCCHAYSGYLTKRNFSISMTENGDPLENAIAERINRTIKEEFTDDKTLTFKTFQNAEKELPRFIRFYNNVRPHRSIEMMTPVQAHQRTGKLRRCWKAYYPQWEEEEGVLN